MATVTPDIQEAEVSTEESAKPKEEGKADVAGVEQIDDGNTDLSGSNDNERPIVNEVQSNTASQEVMIFRIFFFFSILSY